MNPGEKTRLAVMSSGTGTNFVALCSAAKNGSLDARVEVLICDKPGAAVLERAAEWGVPSLCVNPRDFATKAEYEQIILNHLQSLNVELVALAGYMRIVGPTLLDAFAGRMLNIHPSLLPHFPGINALERSYEGGHGGVTVHLVDSGLDTGPTLGQSPVERTEEDTLDSFAARVHTAEHQLFPSVIQKVIEQQNREELS